LESPFPVVTVEGDPYSCGEQHGSKAKDLVRRNIGYYLGLWRRHLGPSRGQVLERAEEFVEPIRAFDADLLEEMRGLADGAGASLEEVIAINSRYELVWSQMGSARGGCTAMAALPKATATGHTLLAQNWDYKVGVRDSCIVLEVLQEGKPAVVMHTEAGIIGHKGINSEGLGLVVNAMVSDRDRFEPGVPFWVLCRRALNSRGLAEAMSVVLSTGKAVSSNVILAQAGGAAVDLESTPLDVSIITPERGVLVHTNHFVGPRSLSVRDEFVKTFSHSIYRYARAQSYLERRSGGLTSDSIAEVLRDHFGWPYSICAHEDPDVEEDYRGETLASVIFDLEDRGILITRGPPCRGPYQELDFPSLRSSQPTA